METYLSSGTICVKGPYKLVFALCDISYELHSNGAYRYLFTPHYSIIDLLSSDVFQGIPGLNLDLRKESYLRENKTPTFISERVPSENREDYYELLSKLDMEYMDPIQYLIRSKDQYSGDGLFVSPLIKKRIISYDSYISNTTNSGLLKDILSNICLGHDMSINGQLINDDNRKVFYDVFLGLYSRSYNSHKEAQLEGIEKAKTLGAYKGRKPIEVDELKFKELLDKISHKELTSKEAAQELGISIDKFYRFKKELQK